MSLYFMWLQIGALGIFRAYSYIHGWRSISALFRCSPTLSLGIEIYSSRMSYLHVSLHINLLIRVHTCQVQSMRGKSASEHREALRRHFMSLQTVTLDSETLAFIFYSIRLPVQITMRAALGK